MSGLQKQIIDINTKVNQLYDVVERLSQQIAILARTEAETLVKEKTIGIEVLEPMVSSESINDVSCPSVLNHKDILREDNCQHDKLPKNYYADANVSPELQIQRLTAQLTAAYNRIANLEEQLLSSRIHHL